MRGLALGMSPIVSTDGKPLNSADSYHRYELKFYLHRDQQAELKESIRDYMKHDQHSLHLPQRRYTVRSIYFDTDDLLFYFEKHESAHIRKKLRVRTYNQHEELQQAFLEIKRKWGRRGYKERLCLPLPRVDGALNGKDPSEIISGRPYCDRKVLDRFRFLLKVKHLHPVVLVSYEREAFVGMDNDRIRITFDQNLRSLINPSLDQIFLDDELKQYEDRFFILEFKFDNRMPRWMGYLIRSFNLRPQSYSKYCHGIDAWIPPTR